MVLFFPLKRLFPSLVDSLGGRKRRADDGASLDTSAEKKRRDASTGAGLKRKNEETSTWDEKESLDYQTLRRLEAVKKQKLVGSSCELCRAGQPGHISHLLSSR